ncbi:hypothetical protein GKJ23_18085 [Vibrio cholerae]|nr:hypothetical protein [Vibrio cholerae]
MLKLKHNKRLKRDCQRVAFPVPMSCGGYGCKFKPCGSVASPLGGRYMPVIKKSIAAIISSLKVLKSATGSTKILVGTLAIC